jgi:hypothetical protein
VAASRHGLEERPSDRLIERASSGCFPSVWLAARTSSSGVRTGNHPKVRLSATVGEEHEIEVVLV